MAEPILDFLESSYAQYLDDLRFLAGIDSGTDHKPGVDAVQTWLGEQFAAAGFDVNRVPQTAWGDDLIARRKGSGQARIMLIGHADTVYPLGTAVARPIAIQGEKLLGPGTCDMKAGLLTGLYAIRALDSAGWSEYGEITFVVVSDEEIEDRHSSEMLKEEGPKHHAVLTLEAARANGDIVTARKATRWVTVRVDGKAAHAGVEPEKGRSATIALAHILVETYKLNGLKDGMTVNPGLLEGGPNPNVVSSHAQAVFDLRAWSAPDLNALTSTFEEVAKHPWVPGTTVHVEWNDGMPAMERNAGTARLESHAVAIAGELGFPLKGAKTGGGSDVSFACHAGTPGLDGLGPIGGLDHGPDEYILHGSIVPRTALLAKLLQAIGSDKELIDG